MDLDVCMLSRIQFAMTIAFHYIYPPMSIGLGVLLVIMESAWLITKNPLWHQMARFWTKIFALTFAIGVATGLVMEFEFGTNWAAYSRFVGDVFGSALAAEGIFAFFLESGFLAVLLFGWDKVRPSVHFFATCMVCLGAHFSAVWIVIANSWMQTPTGYHVVQGPNGPRAEITDFWQVVFSPSSMERLSHVLLGAWLAGAFLVLSISAWYLLKQRHEAFAKASLKVGLVMALVAALLQLATGHVSAMGVAKNQPAKLAAMEGHYETKPGDLWLFGWVDESARQVKGGVALPGMLSWMVYGDASKPVMGLDEATRALTKRQEIVPADLPPVNLTFQAYHLMIAVGMSLIGLTLMSAFLWWRGRLWTCRPVLWLLVASVLGPQIGNQMGWMAAEVGRQPWIVYGVMRTREAVSPTLSIGEVWISLIMFTGIYSLLLGVFLYLLNDKISKGPEDLEYTGPILKLPRAG